MALDREAALRRMVDMSAAASGAEYDRYKRERGKLEQERLREQMSQDEAGLGSAWGSAGKLAGLGGMIGSFIPGIGTAIGAGIGGVAGLALGGLSEHKRRNEFKEKYGHDTGSSIFRMPTGQEFGSMAQGAGMIASGMAAENARNSALQQKQPWKPRSYTAGAHGPMTPEDYRMSMQTLGAQAEGVDPNAWYNVTGGKSIF